MLKRHLPSLVLAAWLAGCGGSTFSNISAVRFPEPPPEPEAHFHFGGVRLAEPVAEAVVQAGGQQVETDEAGQFVVEGEVGNRVTARVPSGPLLAAEVAEVEPGFVWLSPVTTMVSRYRQTHPGVSLAEADKRVRTYLEIPEEVDLGSGLGDTWRSPFSWTAFAEAAGSTPLDLFLDQQVAQVDSGPPRPFRLRDPYGNLRQFMGVLPLPEDEHEGHAHKGDLAAAALGGAHGDFYSAVGVNLVAELEGANLVSVAGWVCEALGLNLAVTAEQLEDIDHQLEHVLEELAALRTALPAVEPALQAPLARILERTEAYLAMVHAGPPATPGEPIAAPPEQAATFATELTGYSELATDLQLLGQQLVGADSLPLRFARSLQQEVGKTNPSGQLLFADWRTNAILEHETDFLLFYQVYQALGLNLLAERSHLDGQSFGSGGSGNVQAASMAAALGALRELAANVRLASQQVPPVSIESDDVMVDVASEVMWYNQQSHLTGEQVEPFLAGFIVGHLHDWRLPSLAEWQGLRTQALAAGGGNPLVGLQRMGFHVDHGTDFLAAGPLLFNLNTGATTPVQLQSTGGGGDDGHGHSHRVDEAGSYHLLVARDCPGEHEEPGTLRAVATPTGLDAGVAAANGTTAGTRIDYTPLVAWASSDPSQLDVSNLPATLGQLIFHREVPVASVAASLLTGYSAGAPTSVRGIVPVLPRGPAPELKSLVLTPNNRVVSGANVVLYATGQYSDQTVRDLTGNVTWSASQGTFEGNVLRLAGSGTVTVTATVNSTTAQATFRN